MKLLFLQEGFQILILVSKAQNTVRGLLKILWDGEQNTNERRNLNLMLF